MNYPAFRPGLAFLCGFILAVRLCGQTAARIPLEYFFATSECDGMRLSPDGKRVAYYAVFDDSKAGIELLDLETGKREPLVYSAEERIQDYFWKGSEHIVFGGDPDALEYSPWCSIPVAPPAPGKKRPVVELGYLGVSNTMPSDPVRFLTDRGKLVDVRDGSRTLVPYFSDGPSTEWGSGDTQYFPDNRGLVPIRTRVMGDKYCVDLMNDKLHHFDQITAFPVLRNRWWLKSFAQDNETLYLFSTEKSDTIALHTFNIRTQKLSAPLFVAPEGEITRIVTSWDKSKLYAVEYYSDRPHLHFFDAAQEKLQRSIDAALPGTQNSIIDTSQDEQVLLIQSWSDRDPGTYYILNRKLGRLGAVGKIRGHIDPAVMRPKESISFTTRDGLTIHGYLTRPAGSPNQRVPLVLHPNHFGFGARDSWEFDAEVQFLANRGYAVLQVNTRGSGGYGEKFEQAGYHEWGGKMQDDLTDAVQWAVAQGVADPARVAIFGESYGGYAALSGLVFTPELYCCGANRYGQTDLKVLVGMGRKIGHSNSGDAFVKQMLGDDKEFLTTRSPINYIERLRAPLFNAYADNDTHRDSREWERLEAKLKKFNKTYEMMIVDNKGHGYFSEKDRLEYYRKLEAFFDRYLAPVRSGSADAKSSLAPAKTGN